MIGIAAPPRWVRMIAPVAKVTDWSKTRESVLIFERCTPPSLMMKVWKFGALRVTEGT